ncbi:hypothetical protein ElyMa_003275100 [Elysia marginata]|uniref:Uncharacterized protein n=1 Tax=Elysia marginata TaxID=1093978 RepID=A0AAV4JBR0_9GAST|nr:hypothetical protein ElyMa_003275100 [Elysia marginata]
MTLTVEKSRISCQRSANDPRGVEASSANPKLSNVPNITTLHQDLTISYHHHLLPTSPICYLILLSSHSPTRPSRHGNHRDSCYQLYNSGCDIDVQGTGKIYLALLSYKTADDVIKTCCDVVSNSNGLCDEDNMCGLSFYISLASFERVKAALLPAPLAWKSGTLTPTVFEFDGWAGGETTIGLRLVMGDLMTDGHLIDSASAALTIAGPSDFYSNLTIRTDMGAEAQFIYRLACDTSYAGDDCATNCLEQPQLQVCKAQARQGPGGVNNRGVSQQALKYFGSPLARCPNHPGVPTSTVSPSDEVSSGTPTGASSLSSSSPSAATSSSETSSPPTTAITDGDLATDIFGTNKPGGGSSLPTTIVPSVVPTKVQTSELPDITSTSSQSLESSSGIDSLYTTTTPTHTTQAMTPKAPSTTQTTTIVSTQQQPIPTTSASVLPTLITSTQPLLTTAASTKTSPMSTSSARQTSLFKTTLEQQPTVTATPTLPAGQTTATTSIPTQPATLPVVQYTSTDPAHDPVTSRPSVTIPEFPATTALAQTAKNPMRYWAIIVGGVVGGLAVMAILGFLLYRSRQKTLQKRQEIYTVTPQSISSIEENGTSGRSDVPMTTALL